MRFPRTALVVAAAAALTLPAMAEEAGVQILIDMQDPVQIQKHFCVRDSKLYSVDALICVSGTISLTCKAVDEADATKGVKWIQATEEKNRCRQ